MDQLKSHTHIENIIREELSKRLDSSIIFNNIGYFSPNGDIQIMYYNQPEYMTSEEKLMRLRDLNIEMVTESDSHILSIIKNDVDRIHRTIEVIDHEFLPLEGNITHIHIPQQYYVFRIFDQLNLPIYDLISYLNIQISALFNNIETVIIDDIDELYILCNKMRSMYQKVNIHSRYPINIKNMPQFVDNNIVDLNIGNDMIISNEASNIIFSLRDIAIYNMADPISYTNNISVKVCFNLGLSAPVSNYIRVKLLNV